MDHAELRARVCAANRRLPAAGLVTLTWGNVSELDPSAGVFGIKPSGVPYDELTPESIVVLDLSGERVSGDLRASSDAPTHAALYRHAVDVAGGGRPPPIMGITHTHSPKATAFAQARRPIPCLGTTHADLARGEIPVCRPLTAEEVAEAYELRTGTAIVELLAAAEPGSVPAVLAAGHAPFCFGSSAGGSVDAAVALEAVAGMALDTMMIAGAAGSSLTPLEGFVLDKHQARKHGPDAYYGQRAREGEKA